VNDNPDIKAGRNIDAGNEVSFLVHVCARTDGAGRAF